MTTTGDDCDHLTANQLVAALPGLTYRRLSYWTTLKLARAHRHVGGRREPAYAGAYGSGHSMFYDAGELEVLRLVSTLTEPPRRGSGSDLVGGVGMAPYAAFLIARDPDMTLHLEAIGHRLTMAPD